MNLRLTLTVGLIAILIPVMIAQLHWAYAIGSNSPLTAPITGPIVSPTITVTPTITATPSVTPTSTPTATPTPTAKPEKPKPVRTYQVTGWVWYDVQKLFGNQYKRVGEQPAVNARILVIDFATQKQIIAYTNKQGKFTFELPTGFYYMEARDSQGLFAPFSRIAIVNKSNISGFNFWKNIYK